MIYVTFSSRTCIWVFPRILVNFFSRRKKSHLSDSTSSKKHIGKMKPESSNKYEEIDPPYLPNKLLNKDSSKTIKINKPKRFF